MHNWHMRPTDKKIRKAGTSALVMRRYSCRGQSVVEFALVAIPFFFLVFGVIDFSWALFNQMNVQDAVREAGRYAATGNHRSDAKGNSISRTASIIQVLDELAIGSGVSIKSVAISSSDGSVTFDTGTGGYSGTGDAGGPGDTVTITATCAAPMLTSFIGTFFASDSKYHFTASATFKNEPFLPSQTK